MNPLNDNERRYLSWDIGIKNLAYCIIKKTNMQFKIEKWGIINLSEEEKICTENNKFEIKCTSKAHYQKGDNFYCNKHLKCCKTETVELLQLPLLDKKDKKDKKDISLCCYEIKNNTDLPKICAKNASCYIEDINKPYCKAHGLQQKVKMEKDKNVKDIVKKNANKISLDILSIKLFTELGKMKDFLTVNEILIENQPSLTNPTMKSIMMLLYSYFVIFGLSDNKDKSSKIEIIRFISPSNKLKVSSGAINEIDKIKNNRKAYILTKSIGIKFCMDLIKDDIDNLNLIKNTKKKDDMCDAFLQGYHYIFCKNGVPKDVETILNKLVEDDSVKSKKINDKNAIDLLEIDI
jgi:hypothetical protein